MNHYTSFYYKEYGKGEPVILLHGFCETGEIWNGFVDTLSQKYRLLIPDLPGFGKSTILPGDFSIDDIGKLIGTWLQELRITNCAVIGHSLGGYVMLALAKNNPELLEKIGLFHSTALADSDEKKDSRNKTIEFIQKYGSRVFAESFAPSLFYDSNRNIIKKDVLKVVKIASNVNEKSLVKYTEAMRDRNDRTDVLTSFENPILFIAGEYDTVIPIEKVNQQIELPKYPVVGILKNTGHMGMLERKTECLTILENFLAPNSS